MRKLYIVFLLIATFFLVSFITSTVGNPMYKALATSYAKQYIAQQFELGTYTIEAIGFNYDSKMYDYIVKHNSDNGELAYTLSIDSQLADRTVNQFSLHPSLLNESLSEQLAAEASVHIQNVVNHFLPTAKIDYKLFVPNSVPTTTVWKPGFELDLNGIISIDDTVDEWDSAQSTELMNALKDALAENGIRFSTVKVRIATEYEKEGITYFKTVYKNILYETMDNPS
jgi:nucleotide-binding universal stress UspA family protein